MHKIIVVIYVVILCVLIMLCMYFKMNDKCFRSNESYPALVYS